MPMLPCDVHCKIVLKYVIVKFSSEKMYSQNLPKPLAESITLCHT